MAAADGGLAGLVTAGGVVLREAEDGLTGSCPRCVSRLVVDSAADAWSCAGICGSGGAAKWVALVEGVSVSHAAELLRAGWQPTLDKELPAGQRSVRLLSVLCAADADDATLLDAVVDHYASTLSSCEPARAWLDRLGVDESLALRLRLSYANRTLGYRLPEANRKDGATLRGRLAALGVYRESGHEHLTGCLVIPIIDAGRVVVLCGHRTDRPALRSSPPGCPVVCSRPCPHARTSSLSSRSGMRSRFSLLSMTRSSLRDGRAGSAAATSPSWRTASGTRPSSVRTSTG
jgi:hypothetical protein